MKHSRNFWMAAVAALLITGGAYAAPVEGKGRVQPPQTRAEAIKRVEERLATLKSMSDEEWQKKKEARREKFQERKAKRLSQRDRKAKEAAEDENE